MTPTSKDAKKAFPPAEGTGRPLVAAMVVALIAALVAVVR